MSKLSGITIRDAEYVKDVSTGDFVFHVKDPHALIQAAGYIKYVSAEESKEGIFFRGQAKIYTTLIPSLFRGCTNPATNGAKRIGILNKFVDEVRKKNKIFSTFHASVHEPILQHYGICTTWIDLVDNIWIALWFACHKARFTGAFGHYLHFETRMVDDSIGKEEFAYILLVGADISKYNEHIPGYYKNGITEFVDLRMAVPSIFLRPHAQHGVVFRHKGDAKHRPLDYGSSVRGIIRVRLSDALKWLGVGSLLNTHALFPPPVYDQGYEYLLSSNIPGNRSVGAISHIGA